VVSVEVKEIDAAVTEILESIRKAGADQSRKAGEVRVVILAPLRKHALVILPGMSVARPRVYGVTGCREAQGLNRLRESRITGPRVRSELDEDVGLKGIDDPERERDMLELGGRIDGPIRLYKDDWTIEWRAFGLYMQTGIVDQTDVILTQRGQPS
jgi:hypothetical protein